MLDTFEILSTSGVVLWSRNYSSVGPSIVNSFIRDVFIEEQITPIPGGADDSTAPKPTYKKEGYTLKWTTAKEAGLIFVAVYQSLVHLTWIDKLLDNVRILFTRLYGEQLKKRGVTVIECPFDNYFDRQIQELEARTDGAATPSHSDYSASQLTPPSSSGTDDLPQMPEVLKPQPKPTDNDNTSADVTPVPTPETSRPSTPSTKHLLVAKGARPGGKPSRRDRRAKAAVSSAPASSGDEEPMRRGKKGTTKRNRVWDDIGGIVDNEGSDNLDYSVTTDTGADLAGAESTEAVKAETMGRRTKKGEFVLKDLDDEIDSIIASAKAEKDDGAASKGLVGSSLGAIGGLFRNVVGGKVLTKKDLEKPLKGMEDHLLKKNVAREAALRLCESVENDLIGTKTNSFTSIDTTLHGAMESALRKILTPTTSLDLLHEITRILTTQKRPYVLSIVGVNGVGKSTNLSKLAFFLLQNRYRVLIVAADTFRSGAVEQLRVHVRNLKELARREGAGEVDIFERGYGKDAANIARDAVQFAGQNGWDVVLIDTAGRRHNDTRLMSSLEKFAQLAQPDKILMVGEALTGTDSVAQARSFNAALGATRKLDGFIVSKCDTVGDMVGVLVSMVHATGIPVVFLGVGQHYGDLRGLNVGWVTRLLMS